MSGDEAALRDELDRLLTAHLRAQGVLDLPDDELADEHRFVEERLEGSDADGQEGCLHVNVVGCVGLLEPPPQRVFVSVCLGDGGRRYATPVLATEPARAGEEHGFAVERSFVLPLPHLPRLAALRDPLHVVVAGVSDHGESHLLGESYLDWRPALTTEPFTAPPAAGSRAECRRQNRGDPCYCAEPLTLPTLAVPVGSVAVELDYLPGKGGWATAREIERRVEGEKAADAAAQNALRRAVDARGREQQRRPPAGYVLDRTPSRRSPGCWVAARDFAYPLVFERGGGGAAVPVETPAQAAHFVSLLRHCDPAAGCSALAEVTGRVAGGWQTLHEVVALRACGVVERCFLLRNLLAGLGLDAWVCSGSLKRTARDWSAGPWAADEAGEDVACVLTREKAAGDDKRASQAMPSAPEPREAVVTPPAEASPAFRVTLWDPPTGSRAVLSDHHPQARLLYIHSVVNHANTYTNSRGDLPLTSTVYAFEDGVFWHPLPLPPKPAASPLQPVCLRAPGISGLDGACELPEFFHYLPVSMFPVAPPFVSPAHAVEVWLEEQLVMAVAEHRERCGLPGAVVRCGEVYALLSQCLWQYEHEKMVGQPDEAAALLFRAACAHTVPRKHSLRACPVHFATCHPAAITNHFLTHKHTLDVIQTSELRITLTVRTRVTLYPEGLVSVWVVIAAQTSRAPLMLFD
ncbi:hypothetical protein DIPPA_14898 [Diplonema papillatum]|nr:hypothetical protein DIPPA_14898 [Diplonema papillatum]